MNNYNYISLYEIAIPKDVTCNESIIKWPNNYYIEISVSLYDLLLHTKHALWVSILITR